MVSVPDEEEALTAPLMRTVDASFIVLVLLPLSVSWLVSKPRFDAVVAPVTFVVPVTLYVPGVNVVWMNCSPEAEAIVGAVLANVNAEAPLVPV